MELLVSFPPSFPGVFIGSLWCCTNHDNLTWLPQMGDSFETHHSFPRLSRIADWMGLVTLVAIIGTTVLVSSHPCEVTSTHLKISRHKWVEVPDLHIYHGAAWYDIILSTTTLKIKLWLDSNSGKIPTLYPNGKAMGVSHELFSENWAQGIGRARQVTCPTGHCMV